MRQGRNILLNVLLAISCISVLSAQTQSPQSIINDELKWISPPAVQGLQFAWIHGNETDAGIYALRVVLESGTRIPPHTHPDQRLSTVLSGTLYVGFGEVFDQKKLVALEAGNAYIAPADTPHFIWAKDGNVTYQETGHGPTATRMLNN